MQKTEDNASLPMGQKWEWCYQIGCCKGCTISSVYI